MTVRDYRAHVLELGRTHRVVICEQPERPPEAAVARQMGHLRMICISPIVDETIYAVALHELGHCVAPAGADATRDNSRSLTDQCKAMEEEDAAWGWAQSVALEWTPAMEMIHQMGRESYRRIVVEKFKATVPRARGRSLSEWK